MADNFEILFAKAIAAAKSGSGYGWPRFYVMTSAFNGGSNYFMAVDENKKGTLHGYEIDWPAGRRAPKNAVIKNIWNPRQAEVGWKLTNPAELPAQVVKKFREKIDG